MEAHNAAATHLATHAWRYVVIAGLTALGYLVLVALGLAVGLHYFVAILISQAITIVCAFPFYRRFVFESFSGWWNDFARFLVVWAAGAVSGIVLTPLLVELLQWHPLVAQTIAIGALSIGSFLSHRWFTFSANGRPAAPPVAATPENATENRNR